MTEPLDSAQYKQVRGFARGLAVLSALNAREGGRATSSELAKATGLHRSTVRRLLETLVEEGFAHRSESDDHFRLLLRVRELADGFTDVEWVSAYARPVMAELLQKVVWPSDLTTPSGDAMIVRETTHRFSPLSFARAMVGRRLPMFLTASGRCYFAYCPADEQENILRVVRGGTDAQSALARDPRFVKNLVDRVRADGFSTNHGEWAPVQKMGALAMPVLHQGRPLGCINVIYLTRAVSISDATATYAPPLSEAVKRIEDMIRKAPPGAAV